MAASLRAGLWNDADADVLPLDISDLRDAGKSFGGRPIYGWEFIDPAIRERRAAASWRSHQSLSARPLFDGAVGRGAAILSPAKGVPQRRPRPNGRSTRASDGAGNAGAAVASRIVVAVGGGSDEKWRRRGSVRA